MWKVRDKVPVSISTTMNETTKLLIPMGLRRARWSRRKPLLSILHHHGNNAPEKNINPNPWKPVVVLRLYIKYARKLLIMWSGLKLKPFHHDGENIAGLDFVRVRPAMHDSMHDGIGTDFILVCTTPLLLSQNMLCIFSILRCM